MIYNVFVEDHMLFENIDLHLLKTFADKERALEYAKSLVEEYLHWQNLHGCPVSWRESNDGLISREERDLLPAPTEKSVEIWNNIENNSRFDQSRLDLLFDEEEVYAFLSWQDCDFSNDHFYVKVSATKIE